MKNFGLKAGMLCIAAAISASAIADGLNPTWLPGGYDGITVNGSKEIGLTLNTLVQGSYTFSDNDGSDNASSFDVNHAVLMAHGDIADTDWGYWLDADFAQDTNYDNGNRNTSSNLRDALLYWKPCGNSMVRLGQFRTAFSRQSGAFDGGLQFTDRSLATNFFSFGRQGGAQVDGSWVDGMITGSAGIFNGTSSGEGQNTSGIDTDHAGVLSLRVNPTGHMDLLTEGDYAGTKDLATSFGVTYVGDAGNFYNPAAETNLNLARSVGYTRSTVSVDGNIRYMGAALQAELYTGSRNDDGTSDNTNVDGFYVQAGYYIVPQSTEIAARYSAINYEGSLSDSQTGVALTHFIYKNRVKATLGYDHYTYEATTGDTNDNRWMLQATMAL